MSRNLKFNLPKTCDNYEFKLVEELILWPHPASAHHGKISLAFHWILTNFCFLCRKTLRHWFVGKPWHFTLFIVRKSSQFAQWSSLHSPNISSKWPISTGIELQQNCRSKRRTPIPDKQQTFAKPREFPSFNDPTPKETTWLGKGIQSAKTSPHWALRRKSPLFRESFSAENGRRDEGKLQTRDFGA